MSKRNSIETSVLLGRLNGGDRSALDQLLESHRGYLRKLVDLRMENELRTRIDPSDVVQETQLMASRKISGFLDAQPVTFRVWLRGMALERLIDLRRRHLAAKRSVRRELHVSDASSLALAQCLLEVRPSQVLRRKELAEQIRGVIMKLKQMDREILLLRHVEQLSNAEAAEVLCVQPDTSRRRLGRAMVRLTKMLTDNGIQIDR